MDYRYKEDVSVIRFPKGVTDEDRGLTECCSPFLVMAHPTENDTYKNDTELAYEKKGLTSDSVAFTIEDCDGNILTNLGEAAIFPNDNLAIGFMYDWQQYLNTYGAGVYTIKVVFTIAGVAGGYTWGQYNLKQFSIENAKGSVRIKSEFNSYYLPKQIDFTNSNCLTTLRFRGYFGDRQPKTEINQYVDKSRSVVKATRENLNEYTLRTDPVTYCITSRLLDFHLLTEDICYLSDHNSSNHSYQYFDLPVVLEESPEVEYRDKNRLANIVAKFGDRTKLDKSFFNR
jgi:hypothetical protein